MKREAVCSFETSVNFHWTIWRNIPEDVTFRSLIYHIYIYIYISAVVLTCTHNYTISINKAGDLVSTLVNNEDRLRAGRQ
jgi:hypothetical protein